MPLPRTRYIVKVGNRTSEHPDRTRKFHTHKRAFIHCNRLRGAGFSANIYAIKPEDKVFTHVPYADAA